MTKLSEVISNFISTPGNFISNPGNFISKAWEYKYQGMVEIIKRNVDLT